MTLEGPLGEFMTVRLALRRAFGDVWIYVLTAVCVVLSGVYIGKGSLLPFLVSGGITAVVAVRTRPRLALAVGLASMAIPYTWGPQLPKLGYGIGILVGLVFLVAYLASPTSFRPGAFDFAVLAFAVTPAAIAAFQGDPFHITQWIAPEIILPYLGFRLLFYATDARRVYAPAVIAIGIVVSLIGIWEGLTGHNPIVTAGTTTYSSNGHYVTGWDVPLCATATSARSRRSGTQSLSECSC